MTRQLELLAEPLPTQERPPMKESLAKVYRMLLDAGPRGVTTGDFARAYCTRYGARLDELRKLGMVIVKEKLGRASWRYVLVP